MLLREMPLMSPGKFLKLTLSYEEGGRSLLTAAEARRGYYLGARVVERNGTVESFAMLSGFRRLLQPAKRFSDKKLQDLAHLALGDPDLGGLVEATLSQACERLQSGAGELATMAA